MKAIIKEIEESEYQDMLQDIFGDIDVCGYKYDAAYALEQIDPIAYRVGFSDYSSEHEKWICSECESEYDNEEDAEACCTGESGASI